MAHMVIAPFMMAMLVHTAAGIRQKVPQIKGATSAGESNGWKCTHGSNELGCPLRVPTFTWTSDSIVRVSSSSFDILDGSGRSIEYHFYRNEAYKAGLSGHYTFLVMWISPRQDTEAMPLVVHEHGGGIGYWNEEGAYYGSCSGENCQTQDTYNHEEDAEKLIWLFNISSIKDGQLMNTSLTKRLIEGFRIVMVSYSDHDGYAGYGTPYTNNPEGGEVNGLQASWAAVDYTLKHYETTHYFLHGCSAGSLGVSSLALAMAIDDYSPLPSGVIADSWVFNNRVMEWFDQSKRGPNFKQHPDFNAYALTRKVGWFSMTTEFNSGPENWLRTGFPVPMMWMYGTNDPACGGTQEVIQGAIDAGMGNCKYSYGLMNRALEDTPGSPHRIVEIPGGTHCPSIIQPNYFPEAVEIVDDFIRDKA